MNAACRLLGVAAFCLAGGGSLGCPGAATGPEGEPVPPGTPSWDDVRPIVEQRCARCHSADRLSTYLRLETHANVSALRTNILDKIQTDPPRGQQMPLTSTHTGPDGCTPIHPQVNDRRLTEDEKADLVAYLNRTDHRDFVDDNPPLTAPAVPRLSDAVEYASSEFDVINDGFLTHPDHDSQAYMEEFGYDQREYDQMEDDWFCIELDPGLTDPSYVTGLQLLPGIGQIFLGAQILVDTTGGSAEAKAAAEESGPDWYRCDPGVNFSGAIPLWRWVPGSEPIEMPEQTGLRMEPGWKFVVRADFHTHYDAAEFERLEQNGVIDRDEGTMTWFNQLSLLVRWAEPAAISRDLQWVALGPRTPQERDSFTVSPGESTLSFSATLPDADPGAEYLVFSAEVGMGKNGHTASLTDTNPQTCIANNADFSPKWIEHALYAEDDAPRLDADSELDLRCIYRNATDEDVVWGPESEATVWGRKERCSGVVFYYEASE